MSRVLPEAFFISRDWQSFGTYVVFWKTVFLQDENFPTG